MLLAAGWSWAERPWARLARSALGVCGRVGGRGEPVDSDRGEGSAKFATWGPHSHSSSSSSGQPPSQQSPSLSSIHSLFAASPGLPLKRAGRGDWPLDRRLLGYRVPHSVGGEWTLDDDDSGRDLPDASERTEDNCPQVARHPDSSPSAAAAV